MCPETFPRTASKPRGRVAGCVVRADASCRKKRGNVERSFLLTFSLLEASLRLFRSSAVSKSSWSPLQRAYLPRDRLATRAKFKPRGALPNVSSTCAPFRVRVIGHGEMPNGTRLGFVSRVLGKRTLFQKIPANLLPRVKTPASWQSRRRCCFSVIARCVPRQPLPCASRRQLACPPRSP